MQYSDKDLEALISEVENEFAAHLQKSEEVVEETVEAKEETVEETQELAKSEEKTESEDILTYDDEDIKEMNELYSSMSKSEKEAHYKAIKSVLFGDTEETFEQEDSQVAKSEESKEENSEDKKADSNILAKNEELAKENEELKKSVEKLVAVLTEKVKGSSVPQQKAITSIEYIKKSEDEGKVVQAQETDITKLSKTEIISKLKEKARTETLAKSDRERINAFVFNEISIDKIKDLL